MDMKISIILGQLGQQARKERRLDRLDWLDVDVHVWCDGDHTPSYEFRVCASSQEEAYKLTTELAEKAKSLGVCPQGWYMFVNLTNIGSVYID